MNENNKYTPLINQFLSIKKEQPDALLLFRMGDFYETFFDDAKNASRVLGIALTTRDKKRKNPVPLAGFPAKSLQSYLKKLLDQGIKVAICEQVEDPKKAKKLVKREIVEVITPGTILEEDYLNNVNNNFLTAIFSVNDKWGIASLDISTGEFRSTQTFKKHLIDEIVRIHPTEILIPEDCQIDLQEKVEKFYSPSFTEFETWRYTTPEAEEALKDHFDVVTLDGFGLTNKKAAISASACVLSYIKELKGEHIDHVTNIKYYTSEKHMQVDAVSRHNLELFESIRTRGKSSTLFNIINKTKTPMGNRLLKNWLLQPLLEKEKIDYRLNAIDELLENESSKNQIIDIIKEIGDIERIISKIGTEKVYPRDLISLKSYLEKAKPLAEILQNFHSELLSDCFESIQNYDEIILLIQNSIQEEPPLTITEGGVIKENYNEELDELRQISKDGKGWIANLEEKEQAKTGISSLKIGFNKVFGYYIEVSKVNSENVPDSYIRKQTLVNSERYITPELKEYENKVLGAEERIKKLEHELFSRIRQKMKMFIYRMQKFTNVIAKLDAISNLAQVAYHNNYSKPEILTGNEINIEQARHPVVETLSHSEEFIPNDIYLNNKTDRILLITGPNMAGKSTYLRQVGLIVLMAQIGSYVPAKEAKIGIVDKIFTRVGASDNLALGQSTFLVEMIETANILHNATNKSLILLDEIGRGTSTFDGLSIAWAVVEYLHEKKEHKAKTLFATHYHELTELAQLFSSVKNYNITVNEWKDKIIFLRKVVPGSADQSYGIHVAKLAGVPQSVLKRAREILQNLEKNELNPNSVARSTKRKRQNDDNLQVDIFDVMAQQSEKHKEVIKKLKELDVNKLSPLDALNKIAKLQDEIDED